MPFQVSPGVNVSEIDLTTVVPAVSTTEGGIAGVFRWGPVEQRVLIESENELVQRYGKPTSDNFETFFTAASFLAYGNKLFTVRAADTSLTYNAIAANGTVSNVASQAVKNRDHYDTVTFNANVAFIAKYPGDIGNSLKISVCPSSTAYSQSVSAAGSALTANVAGTGATFTVGSATAVLQTPDNVDADLLVTAFTAGDIIRVGNNTIGYQDLKVTSTANSGGNVSLTFSGTYGLSTSISNVNITNTAVLTLDRYWEFYKNVDKAPGTSTYANTRGGVGDEMHIVVIDEDGAFTGVTSTVLEVFQSVSRASDAVTEDGGTNYYPNVLNENSNYVWFGKHLYTGSNTGQIASTVTSLTAVKPKTISFANGAFGESESNVSIATLSTGYDLFKNAEEVDISLILAGKARGGVANTQLANYIIDNICENRKDCVAYVSPQRSAVVTTGAVDIPSNIVTFRNSLTNSSYAVLDSGYKYAYDRYNDVYRYVPLNGDIAGLTVRTDSTRDPWFSPAGFNRGIIKNVIKLAYNPSKADRDILYKSDINPVVTFPGQGTILYGDKTLLGKPSAFDRINVRRLFIVLEKAIATAAKFTLFEFNDVFTRAQFRNLVEPFLRDVQGRRGIYDYRVVCDETNNTPEVIDRNEFIGDIYIKPARSINFIQLNFVAVRTGVEFNEIVGQF